MIRVFKPDTVIVKLDNNKMDFSEKDIGFSLPCLQKFLQNNPTEELIKSLLYSGLKMDRAKTYKKPAKTESINEENIPLRSTARNPSYLAAIEDTTTTRRNLRDASTSTHDLNSQRPSDPQSWKRLNILHLFGSECELEINSLHKAENQSKYCHTPESERCSSSSGLGSEYSKTLDPERNNSLQKIRINEDDEENECNVTDYSHIYFTEDWNCQPDTPSVLKTSQSSAFELSSSDSEDWDIYDYSDDESSRSSDYSVYFADRLLNRSLSLQDLCIKSRSDRSHDFSHRWSLEALPSRSFMEAKEESGDYKEYYRSMIDEWSCASTPQDDKASIDEERLRNDECDQVVLEYPVDSRSCKSVRKYKSKDIVACKALLRLSLYVNSGLLTIHVISAKKVEGRQFDSCNSYVQVTLHPEHAKRIPWQTNVVLSTKTPVFDEKFSFELLNSDLDRRLLISLWSCDTTLQHTEFLGCMSFGITHVIKKQVNGWYRLLIENVGERKHFASSKKDLPIAMTTAVQEDVRNDVKNFHSYNSFKKDAFDKKSIGSTAYDIKHMAKTPFTISVEIPRGPKGFGFSVTWVQPVRVARIVSDSPADHSGLKVGDRIIFIGAENVVKASDKTILKLIKNERSCLVLEVYRRGLTIMSALPLRHLEGITDSPPSSSKLSHHSVTSSEFGSSTPTLLRSIASRAPTSRISGFNTPPIIRTEFGCHNSGSWSRLNNECHLPADVARRYAIYQLVSCEETFSNFTYFGLDRFVEPLRSKSNILSSTEHIVLFQNIEELVWLSEGFVERLMEGDVNSVGHSVGSIFQEKILELCGAYQFYCNGIHAADTLLTTKMLNPGFLQFLQEPPIPRERLDITSFIHRPVEHFREVLLLLQTILSNTETRHADYDPLENSVETMKLYYKDITTTLDMLEPRIGTTGAIATMAAVTSGTTMEDLEQRLVFTKSAKSFKLCEPGRQWVFGSELQKQDGKTMKACWVMLFTDILVFTRVGRDKVLFVVEDPISITSINRAYFNIKKKNAEFRLIVDRPKDNQNALLSGLQKRHRAIVLRAESTELKTMWQNYIQRQVWLMRGHEYSATVNSGTPGTARKLLWKNAMSITENNHKLNHNAQTPSKKITGTFVLGKKRTKEPTFGRILPSSSGKRQFLLDFLEGRTKHVNKGFEAESADWDFDNDPIANMKGEELAKLRQQMLSRKLPNYFEGEYEEFFFDDDEEEHKSSRGSHSPAPTIRSNLSTPRKHKVSPVMKPKKLSFRLPIGIDAKSLKTGDDAKMNSQMSLDGKDGSMSSKDSKDRAPSVTDSKPFAHIADTLRGSLERLINHGSPLLRYKDSPKVKKKEEIKVATNDMTPKDSPKMSIRESVKATVKVSLSPKMRESPKSERKENLKISNIVATMPNESDKGTTVRLIENKPILDPDNNIPVIEIKEKVLPSIVSQEVKPEITKKKIIETKVDDEKKKEMKETHPNTNNIVIKAVSDQITNNKQSTSSTSVPIRLSNESTPKLSPRLAKSDVLSSLRKESSSSSSQTSINSQSSQVSKLDDVSPKPTPDKIVASSINVMVPQEQKVYSEKFPPQTPAVVRREIRPTELHLQQKDKPILGVKALTNLVEQNALAKSEAASGVRSLTASPAMKPRTFKPVDGPQTGSPQLMKERVQILNVSERQKVQMTYVESPLMKRREVPQTIAASPLLMRRSDLYNVTASPLTMRRSDANRMSQAVASNLMFEKKFDGNKIPDLTGSVTGSPFLTRKTQENAETGIASPFMTRKTQENAETAIGSPLMTRKTQENAETAIASPLLNRKPTQIVTSSPLLNRKPTQIVTSSSLLNRKPTQIVTSIEETAPTGTGSPVIGKKADAITVQEMTQSVTASPMVNRKSDLSTIEEMVQVVSQIGKKGEVGKNGDVCKVEELANSITSSPVPAKRVGMLKNQESVAASPALAKRDETTPSVSRSLAAKRIQEITQSVGVASPFMSKKTDAIKKEDIQSVVASPLAARRTLINKCQEVSQLATSSPMLSKRDFKPTPDKVQTIVRAVISTTIQIDKTTIESPIPARRNVDSLKKSPPVPPPRKFLQLNNEMIKRDLKVEKVEVETSAAAQNVNKKLEVAPETVPVITMDPNDSVNVEKKANSETSSGYQSEKASTDSPAVVHKEAKSPSREIEKMEFAAESKPMSPKEKEQSIKDLNKDSPSSKHKESSVSTGRLSPKKLSMSKSLSSESGTAQTVIKNGDDSSEKLSLKDKRSLKQDPKGVKPSPDRKTTKSSSSSAAASPKVDIKNASKSGVASPSSKTSSGVKINVKEATVKKDVKKTEPVKKSPSAPVENKGKPMPKTTDSSKIKSSEKSKKETIKPGDKAKASEDAIKKSPISEHKKSDAKDASTKAKKELTNASSKGKDTVVKKEMDKKLKSEKCEVDDKTTVVAKEKTVEGEVEKKKKEEKRDASVSPKPNKVKEGVKKDAVPKEKIVNATNEKTEDSKNVEAQGMAAKDASKSPLMSNIQTRIRHRLENKNEEGKRSREGSPRLIKMCNDNKEFYFDADIEKDYPELVGSPRPMRRDNLFSMSIIKHRCGSIVENRRCGSFDEIQSTSSHHYDCSRNRNLPWRGLGSRKDSYNSHSERDLSKNCLLPPSRTEKTELSPSANAGKSSSPSRDLNKQVEVELTAELCPPGSGQCGEEVDRGYVCYRRGSYNSHTHREMEELLRKECVVEVHCATKGNVQASEERRAHRREAGDGGGGGGGCGGGEPPNKCLNSGKYRPTNSGVPYCVLHNHKKAWREVAVYAPPLDCEETTDVNNPRCSPAGRIESCVANLKESAECVVPNGDELGRLGSSLDDMLKCEVWLMNQCGNIEISSAKQSSVSEGNSSAALHSKKSGTGTVVRKTSKCEPTSDSPSLAKDPKQKSEGKGTPKTPRTAKESLSKGQKSSPKTPNKGSSNSSRIKSGLQKDNSDSKCSPAKTSKESRSQKTTIVNSSTNTSGLRKNSECKVSKTYSPSLCSKNAHPSKNTSNNTNNNNPSEKQCISDAKSVGDANQSSTCRLNEVNYMASTSKDGPILINELDKPKKHPRNILAEQESFGSDVTDDVNSPPTSTVRAVTTISNGNVPTLESSSSSPLTRKAGVKVGVKSKMIASTGAVNSPKLTRRDSGYKLAPSPLVKEILDLEATHSPNRRQSTGNLVKQEDEKKGRFNIFGGQASPGSKIKGSSTESEVIKKNDVKSESSKSSWFSWKSWRKSVEDCASLPGTPPNHTPQMMPRGVAKPTLLSPIRHGSDGDLNSWFADK
uniref:Uncharacterized protein n=1 Tax=Strigamia maritima TaxID=126957 RepID=T1J7Q8_STRMM